jgi:hypothetical protein
MRDFPEDRGPNGMRNGDKSMQYLLVALAFAGSIAASVIVIAYATASSGVTMTNALTQSEAEGKITREVVDEPSRTGKPDYLDMTEYIDALLSSVENEQESSDPATGTNPAEDPVDSPAEEPLDSPAEDPVDTPTSKPAITPTEEPVDEPEEEVDEPEEEVDEPEEEVDEPEEEVDEPEDDTTTGTPNDEPVDEPVDSITNDTATEEPADSPAEEPADSPAEEPADSPAEEPADSPAEEPADSPAEEPADEETILQDALEPLGKLT